MNQPSLFVSQKSAVGLVLLPLGLLLLNGCVVEERARVRGPVYVEAAPRPRMEAVVIEVPPPPLREEIIIEQPSPDHIWVRGYWGWRGGQHQWQAGHWELPPQPGCVWVEPRWEHRERGYVFVAGTWRSGPVRVQEKVSIQPTVSLSLNFIAQPPPPPRREVIIERERPSHEHVWIKGYYVWREGRHVWIAGHWERPPHPHAVWVEPRWEHRDRGYVFIEGVWR